MTEQEMKDRLNKAKLDLFKKLVRDTASADEQEFIERTAKEELGKDAFVEVEFAAMTRQEAYCPVDTANKAGQEAYIKGMRDACFELANWLVCKGPKEVAGKERPLVIEQIQETQVLAVGLYHGGPHEDQDVQTAAEFEQEFDRARKNGTGFEFMSEYIDHETYYAPLILTFLLSEAKLQQDPHA